MSIKSPISYKCKLCGYVLNFSFWPDGSVRSHDHWNCPKAPPGPPDPPRQYQLGAVRVAYGPGSFAESLGHVLMTEEDCHEKNPDIDHNRCLICEKGLSCCKRCGAWEVELDEPCVERLARQYAEASESSRSWKNTVEELTSVLLNSTRREDALLEENLQIKPIVGDLVGLALLDPCDGCVDELAGCQLGQCLRNRVYQLWLRARKTMVKIRQAAKMRKNRKEDPVGEEIGP